MLVYYSNVTLIILLISLKHLSKKICFPYHWKILKKNVYSLQGVDDFCDVLDNDDLTPLEAFAEWMALHYGTVGECHDFSYESLVRVHSNTEWDQDGTLSGSEFVKFIATQILIKYF